MMIGSFSSVPVNVYAASLGDVSYYKVEERLAQLASLSGKYFTTNGKANGSSCNYDVMKSNSTIRKLMSTYKGAKTISAYNNIPGHFDWTANGRGNISSKAWLCAGFANFCTWWLYSADYRTRVKVRCVKQNVKFNYKNMTRYVKPGDVLRTSKGNPGHSMIVLRVTKSYVRVFDNNWSHDNRIKVHKIKFKSGYAKNLRVGVTRGKAYTDNFRHRFDFALEGGSGAFSSIFVNDQDVLVIPTNTPQKAGFVFKGWTVKRLIDGTWFDGGAWNARPSGYKLYQPGARYQIDSSWRKSGGADSHFKFYAKWGKATAGAVTVKALTSGAKSCLQSTKQTKGIIKNDNETKEVVAETQPSDPQSAEDGDTMESASSTALAPAAHALCFCLNDGEGIISNIEVCEGVECIECILPDAVPVKEGFSFAGWYVMRTEDSTWFCGSDLGWLDWNQIKEKGIQPEMYMPGEVVCLDALWTEVSNSSYQFYAQWINR